MREDNNKLCISVKEMAKQLDIGLNAAYTLSNSKSFYPAIEITPYRKVINVELLKKWLEEQSKKQKMY